jgi:hypothetical protein
MTYIKKNAASSWSSFKNKTDTGGGEKRFFLGPPTDINIINLDLTDNGKEIKLVFNGSILSQLVKLFNQFKFYRFIKNNYCYPAAGNEIDEYIYAGIIDSLIEISEINETFDGKITNDGSRLYVVSSNILKKISQICLPEISGIVIRHSNNDVYHLSIYFDEAFLKKYNVFINFFDFKDGLLFNNFTKLFQEITIEVGLIFSHQLIQRFIASLCTKPFVICSGLSGSGKTKLAQAFAQWIAVDESQYVIVPVGADWTNREPLLGYPNALNKEEYVSPENGVLDLIVRSKQNIENKEEPTKPYFLILDEMNLSHVERYFADFLSTMESGDTIPLHKILPEPTKDLITIPQTFKLPKNLFIIGTVNIDETTYMFSPKVLDRANTIEFRLIEKDLADFIVSDIKLDMELLKGQGANMSDGFMAMALQETDKNLKPSEADLKLFFSELKKSGAEFGYRTASEIGRLMYMLNELGESGDNLLDIAIMQKLLPKLHGSRSKLNTPLTTLAKFCVKDAVKDFDGKDEDFRKTYFIPFDKLPTDSLDKIKYKISFEKISRMHKNAMENGFTSYAEA